MIARLIERAAKKAFGSRNDRLIKAYRSRISEINFFEEEFKVSSQAMLIERTASLRARRAQGESIEKLLPEAFALVREAADRVLGMRHFDVQLIGGQALHAGQIAEMRTGEGKTLVATLAAFLHALDGKGVHVITVNDYLAQRDADQMGQVHRFLGLTVACNRSGMSPDEKRAAYLADITYGTHSEFGFDYLRDNMVLTAEQRVQRPLHYAILDEVDSILIDEARTPLVISGPAEDQSARYHRIGALVDALDSADFEVDAKERSVTLTPSGYARIEAELVKAGELGEHDSLYSTAYLPLMHFVQAALKARALYERDVHYVVEEGAIHIVDEFTGRIMRGRRWGQGIHQAVEAREGVQILPESIDYASISYQNFFRLYPLLSGMTGTADTDAGELFEVYGLETVSIPTARPVARKDQNDVVYRTAAEKWQAVILDVQDCLARRQPVLIGTTSIETSAHVSSLLEAAGIEHAVLNAKFHANEAQIIANAGRAGAVTVATNMAGRGTDILLGGRPEAHVDAASHEAERALVTAAGGLRVIGTERSESRRIDNQLRGRSGRQGDPGSSQFYLSLEDGLLRHAGKGIESLMTQADLKTGEAIEHALVSKGIARAQASIEERYREIRKDLMKIDDVVNEQRKVYYALRRELVNQASLSGWARQAREHALTTLFEAHVSADDMPENWDFNGFSAELQKRFELVMPIDAWAAEHEDAPEQVLAKIIDFAHKVHDYKLRGGAEASWQGFEREAILSTFDKHWRAHLASLEYLKEGIHLRGYAKQDPAQAYKQEAFKLFEGFIEEAQADAARILITVTVSIAKSAQPVAPSK